MGQGRGRDETRRDPKSKGQVLCNEPPEPGERREERDSGSAETLTFGNIPRVPGTRNKNDNLPFFPRHRKLGPILSSNFSQCSVSTQSINEPRTPRL